MGLRLEVVHPLQKMVSQLQHSSARTELIEGCSHKRSTLNIKPPDQQTTPAARGAQVSPASTLTFRNVPKRLHSLFSLFGTGRTRSDTATPLTCEPRQVNSQPLGFWSFSYQHILLCSFTAPLDEKLPKLSLQDFSLGAPHSLLLLYRVHTCA